MVEFSRELDAAEAPVIQAEPLFCQQEPVIFRAEPLFCQQEPVIFRAEPPVDRLELGILGARGAGGAGTFLLAIYARTRIMRARVTSKTWCEKCALIAL